MNKIQHIAGLQTVLGEIKLLGFGKRVFCGLMLLKEKASGDVPCAFPTLILSAASKYLLLGRTYTRR